MIMLVQSSERQRHARVIDGMHKIRKKVFAERLEWNVVSINSWEIDGYDALPCLYIICVDGDRVLGSLRLMPTTGFNMLCDTFSVLLPEGKRIESPLIWESSRFSVDHELAGGRTKNGVSVAMAELIIGMNQIGSSMGLTHVVSVYDAFFARVLRRIDCRSELIGPPHRIGKVLTYAGFFTLGDEMDERVRDTCGIDYDVMAPGVPVPMLAAS